jgi:hypothetical protein
VVVGVVAVTHAETTRDLVRVLRQRDDLRRALEQSDKMLRASLRAWSDSRPGERGGIATEAGARMLLGRAGLL